MFVKKFAPTATQKVLLAQLTVYNVPTIPVVSCVHVEPFHERMTPLPVTALQKALVGQLMPLM
jgi:hypothetical protein